MTIRSDADHRRKMQKIQQAQARKVATKTVEKGLVIVHTGAGKGKSSAAFGMAVRAIGHQMKVGVVQFVKGAMSTGELGISLAEMIRQDKVHAITSTAANLEEDVFNLVAHDEYRVIENWRALSVDDEVGLLDQGFNFLD